MRADRGWGLAPNSPVWIRTHRHCLSRLQTSPAFSAQSNPPDPFNALNQRLLVTIQQLQTSIFFWDSLRTVGYRGEPGFSLRMQSVIYLFVAFVAVDVFLPGMSVNLSWKYFYLIPPFFPWNITAVIRGFCEAGAFL